jgi:hypothetical protein
MEQQILNSLRQSIYRIILVLVHFLPGVLALLVAMVIFSLIGLALAALLRRLLTAARFDERLAARQTEAAQTITLWAFVLIGVAVGISAFDASYSSDAQYSFFLFPYVAHLTGAVLILLAGTLLARFLSRTVLIGAVNAHLHYARFLSLGVKWLVLTLSAAMALDHLHIGGAVVELAFGILFGGIVLTLALAIGLGSRDLVSRSIESTLGRNDAPKPTAVPDPEEKPRSRLRHF